MLDVIHVIFEDDILPQWEQGAEVKDKARQAIYRDMYGVDYKYGYTSSQGRNSEWEFGGTPTEAPDGIYAPVEGEIKPYIPPTDPSELYDIIDRPLGE